MALIDLGEHESFIATGRPGRLPFAASRGDQERAVVFDHRRISTAGENLRDKAVGVDLVDGIPLGARLGGDGGVNRGLMERRLGRRSAAGAFAGRAGLAGRDRIGPASVRERTGFAGDYAPVGASAALVLARRKKRRSVGRNCDTGVPPVRDVSNSVECSRCWFCALSTAGRPCHDENLLPAPEQPGPEATDSLRRSRATAPVIH